MIIVFILLFTPILSLSRKKKITYSEEDHMEVFLFCSS